MRQCIDRFFFWGIVNTHIRKVIYKKRSLHNLYFICEASIYYIIIYLTSSFFVRSNEVPDQSTKSGTHKWSDNEQPKLAESLTALEQSRTNTTSRIDRCSCYRNTNDMNQYERQTYSQTCKVACTFLRIGSAEDNQYKYESEYSLSNKS